MRSTELISGTQKTQPICQNCGTGNALLYESYLFGAVLADVEPEQFWLCVKCARTERNPTSDIQLPSGSSAISRTEFIAALDRFWSASSAAEICGQCHQQDTGCCPPMCRYLSQAGCQKKNIFCTSFVCSALLNAISECDADLGRLLKWVKTNVAPAEFRLYEMVTRVPAIDREPVRPLRLPEHYPGILQLDGKRIREKLLALADEVLLIRRQWSQEEQQQINLPGLENRT